MILSVLENGGRREYPVSDVVFDRECDLLCVGIGQSAEPEWKGIRQSLPVGYCRYS